jgi:putative flippase GtrA
MEKNMIQPLRFRIISPEAVRFMRFAVVGALGTLIDFSLLIVFKEWVGLSTLIANSLSSVAGIANNFTLNRLWTFSDAPAKPVLVQLAQFVAVSLVGITLNNGIVLMLEAPFGLLPGIGMYGYVLAKVIATGVVIFWNFSANRLWTFKRGGEHIGSPLR